MRQAQQVAAAVAVGAITGGLIIVDVRVVLAVAAAALALLMVPGASAVGGRRLAAAAWAGAAFTAPFNGVRITSFMALSDVFLLFAVAAMLPSLALGGRRPLRSSAHAGVLVGLATIAVGGTVGTVFAVNPEASLVEIAKFVLGAVGSIIAMMLWAPRPSELRWFCALWLAGAVMSGLWAIALDATRAGRPAGLATHPNHLAITCLLGIGVALGFALDDRRRAARILGKFSCPLLIVALLVSASRAALVGLVIVVPAVALFAYRVRLAVRAATLAGVLAVAALVGVIDVPAETGLGRLLGDETTVESDEGRIEHLARSVDRFERHPLTGEGFEFAQEAHNIYLQVLVAAGPLGLVGLSVVVGSVLTATKRGVRAGSRNARANAALLAGLAGGYAGYLITAAFQNILWDRYLWLYVAAALSMASHLGNLRRDEVSAQVGRDNRSPPPDRPVDASPAGGRDASPLTPGRGWSL